jgi:RHS repeat-associated protein
MDQGSNVTRKFVYDALGHWVERSGPAFQGEFFYGSGAEVAAVYDGWARTWVSGNLYLGGRLLVEEVPGGEMDFLHQNALGSTTMVSGYTGGITVDVMFYPWGQEWQGPGGDDNFFASMPWTDAVTGEMAVFRQYSNQWGRWLSPDPLAGDILNPQSLNRYAYARNNPTTLTDPSGLCSRGNDKDDCPDPHPPRGDAGSGGRCLDRELLRGWFPNELYYGPPLD